MEDLTLITSELCALCNLETRLINETKDIPEDVLEILLDEIHKRENLIKQLRGDLDGNDESM